jgi:alpha-ribazole phosphatase/probable phosphoglycerate mutase
MNDLLFIRHAETDMRGTFCGQSDPPVNAAGYEQIARLLRSLRGQSFDAVYTSDLRRALTTAAALADFFNIPCIARPALREIHFGSWEGLTWREIELLDPVHPARWLREYPTLPAPGGESFSSFEDRVSAETDSILRQNDHRRVLVVTHAGVMRSILRTRCMLGENEAWALTKTYCCSFSYPCAIEHVPEMA